MGSSFRKRPDTMSLPSDYLERVYAGVLGKLIGVYIGRPFEGWAHQHILKELGHIHYYVHDRLGFPLVVTDDDVSGTFQFVRALEEHGVSPDLSSEEIGKTWLNNVIEHRTIFWFGGLGMSTEHTAYLNLRNGIPAPLSGAIATNGRTVAEQIGAQIFIDGWGLVSPGQPDIAARLAHEAGSVSHDGESVYAAQLWAAMEAEAFISKDVDHLIDVGLGFIPKDSLVAKVIGNVRGWVKDDGDWLTTRQRIEDTYGYDKFHGACHVIPNHAIMIMTILYAGCDFDEAMHIVNTCGWDTDCNSGNVGCLVAVMAGLSAFEGQHDWRGPLADRALISSADAGFSINNAARITYTVANLGRMMAGEKALVPPKNGAQFHFTLPGSVQGFQFVNQPDSSGVEVAVEQGVDGSNGPGLAIRLQGLSKDSDGVEVSTQTFTPKEVLNMATYELMASPLVYPGQTITALLRNSGLEDVQVGLRLRVYSQNDEVIPVDGPVTTLSPGQTQPLEWTIPDNMDSQPIQRVGIVLKALTDSPYTGTIWLDSLGWTGTPRMILRQPSQKPCQFWHRAWVNGVTNFPHMFMNRSFVISQSKGEGIITCGTREWTDYRVSVPKLKINFGSSLGVAIRVQGLNRYYAVVFVKGGGIALVKAWDAERITLAKAPFEWSLDEEYGVVLEAGGDEIRGRTIAWLHWANRFRPPINSASLSKSASPGLQSDFDLSSTTGSCPVVIFFISRTTKGSIGPTQHNPHDRVSLDPSSMALTLSSQALTIAPGKSDQILQDAVASFRSVLTDDQRLELDRAKSLPDTDAVLVFTAELDLRRRSQRGKSIASRLFSVLQSVRDFSSILDTMVQSNPDIAALVWGSVKLTMLVIVNFTSYYEAFSELFMSLGQVCPRFEQYQALFPTSQRVQKALCHFNASIIRCWHTQLIHAFWESFQQEFKPDLDEIRNQAENVEREIDLARAQAEHRNQELERLEREQAASSRMSLGRFISRSNGQFNKMHEWQLLRDEQKDREQKQKLLDFLSAHDHIKPLKQARRKRYPNSAGWLFETEEFKRWVEGTKTAVGSGKTILTVIDHLLTDKSTPESQVIFFFPRFDEAESHRAETILRSIIRQMVSIDDVSGDTMKFLKDIQTDKAANVKDFARLLDYRLRRNERPTWIIIDGLDECHKDDRNDLTKALESLASAGPHVKIFITSRETAPGAIKRAYPALEQTSMSCSLAQADITGLVNQAVQAFLWVTLQLRELCSQPNDEKIRMAISVRNLPKSLTEIFNRALKRVISGGNEKITQELLPWIIAAKRPLSLAELEESCFISVLQPYAIKDRHVNGIHRVDAWFEGLVEIEEETKTVHFVHASVQQFFLGPPARSAFRGFHIQLEEADHHLGEICVTYLNFNDFKTTLSRRRQPMPPLVPEDICRKALRNQWSWIKPVGSSRSARENRSKAADIEETLANFSRSTEAAVQKAIAIGHPFLGYAATYWLLHSTAFSENRSKTWSLWRQMVTGGHGLSKSPVSDGHHESIDEALVNWAIATSHSALLHAVAASKELMERFSESMFQSAAKRGDVPLLIAMLQVKEWGAELIRPLYLSAQGGHLEMVKLLIDAGADINPSYPNEKYRPLMEAARMGRVEVVELLLKAGADASAPTYGFQNALQPAAAVQNGNGLKIVKLLIKAGAPVNAAPSASTGRTALQEACERGFVQVVKMLLSAGADVNAAPGQERGGTALQLSIISRNAGLVRLLLDAGADVNAPPPRFAGRTALQQASDLSFSPVPSLVKLLLEAGAEVNAKPAEVAGHTALQAAARHGSVEVMKLLMEAGADVNAGPAAVEGGTALYLAASAGSMEAVEMLLKAGADILDDRHSLGKTAAELAAEKGHDEVAKRLELAAGWE
ncbi:hypothetical protein ACJ41O_003455 [Fusarium nematophilum]